MCVLRQGRGMVCCLRWCASVQSGTVSVQPHPWSGLVGVSAIFCDPPAPPSGWGGQSHCLCLSQSSLLCSELEDRSSWSATGLTITLNLFTHPHFPTPLFPIPSPNPLCSTDCMPTCMYCRFLLKESNKLVYFLFAACAKSTPGCYQITDMIIHHWNTFSSLGLDTIIVCRALELSYFNNLHPNNSFLLSCCFFFSSYMKRCSALNIKSFIKNIYCFSLSCAYLKIEPILE